MAIKKSDLYSSIWASRDELRGGMDASQYMDYVLFIKYVSDNYADYNGFEPPIVIPTGAGFRDMVALKVAAEAGKHITLEGQEKDGTTAGSARINLILHDFPTTNIASGSEGTLARRDAQ